MTDVRRSFFITLTTMEYENYDMPTSSKPAAATKDTASKAADRPAAQKVPDKNSDKKKSAKKSAAASFSKAVAKRREEIIGVMIVVLSTLLLIAIFAYAREDDATIENISPLRIFSEEAALAAAELKNPLGLLGAMLSGFLMTRILGYPTALIIIAAGVWGWNLFRRRGQEGFERASYFTVYAVLFAVLVASMFGLTSFGISEAMSGACGRLIADVLRTAIGLFGAWSALAVLMGITIILLIDLDVQKTIDRIKFLSRGHATEAKVRFGEWYAARKARRALRDAELEAEHAEQENEDVEIETAVEIASGAATDKAAQPVNENVAQIEEAERIAAEKRSAEKIAVEKASAEKLEAGR
ncbi:MAG: DNA translocase FtsK 4TM domain-containing protein, partial [Rhizobacter sp.]|nr:DNA translocase FtsK 4TM domain-containing protein [Chlorobiales bacterium]